MIAYSQMFDVWAHLYHNASTLVTEYRRKCTLRIISRQRKGVRMTHAGRFHFHQYLTIARTFQVDINDLKGLTCGKRHSSSCFHRDILVSIG